DGHVDRTKDLIPTGAEHGRHLLPPEALGPPRQKPHVADPELVLAGGPWHLLDTHTTARAVDPAHHVQEEHAQPPQRHELEAAWRQPVVLRPPLPTPRTLRPIPCMRVQIDRERRAVDLILESHVAVDKSSVLLNPIQDSLDLHPVVRLRAGGEVWSPAILSESTRDASSRAAPPRVEADGSVDAENAPTDPCKTTERFCTSSHTPHRRFPFQKNQDQNLSESVVSYPQILR